MKENVARPPLKKMPFIQFTSANTNLQPFTTVCYEMALLCLHHKVAYQTFDPLAFELNPEDLAIHVIMPLFQHNDQQLCTGLTPWFQEYLQAGRPEQYRQRTRRVVFSAVEENVSPYYSQLTPSLDPFIERLTAAAQASGPFSVVETNGLQWFKLEPFSAETNLPVIPLEFLGIRLHEHLPDNPTSEEVLHTVQQLLSAQTVYRQSLPVSMLAKAADWILESGHKVLMRFPNNYSAVKQSH